MTKLCTCAVEQSVFGQDPRIGQDDIPKLNGDITNVTSGQ
jgi:hypothetical protein